MDKITLVLENYKVDVILNALSELPYRVSAGLISDIVSQTKKQPETEQEKHE